MEEFFETMASRTKWTEKLQAQGRDLRVADVLEALGKEKKRNREDEHAATRSPSHELHPGTSQPLARALPPTSPPAGGSRRAARSGTTS